MAGAKVSTKREATKKKTAKVTKAKKRPAKKAYDGRKRAPKVRRNGPKRALSAYMYFVKVRRSSLKAANPFWDNCTLISKLAAQWRSMSVANKAPFAKRAEKDKKRYEREKKTYVKPAPVPVTTHGNKFRKPGPKKNLSAYNYFVMLQRDNVKAANKTATNRKIISKLGVLWRKMSDSEKSPYEAKAKKDLVRYKKAKEKFDELRHAKNIMIN